MRWLVASYNGSISVTLSSPNMLRWTAIGRHLYRDGFRAAVFLLIVLNLCFFSSIWGGKTLLASAKAAPSIMPSGSWAGRHDAPKFAKNLDSGGPAFVTEPLVALLHNIYVRDKTLPLWNPYQGYGVPLAADMQSQPYYPLMALLSLHPAPRSYDCFILMRLFIAGICAYAYLRLFVSFIPALAGGVTSMLAGYYILFITMPQLSVETLLPASLWSAERLLRAPTPGRTTALAAIVCLGLLGGMPESSLLQLILVLAYILFRFMADTRLRRAPWRTLRHVIVAICCGVAASGILLLPFLEFARHSFDLHQPHNIGGSITGLRYERLGPSICTYLFPLIFGPPSTSTLGSDYGGCRNYFGLLATLLVLFAIAGGLRRNKRSEILLTPLTWFFISAIAVILLKRYGFAPINMIGYLPPFQPMNFLKYDEAILSIAVSILCAIGLERLLKNQLSFTSQILCVCLVSALVALVILFSWPTLRQEVRINHVPRPLLRWSIIVPVFLLVCSSFSILSAKWWVRRNTSAKPDAALRLGLTVLFFLTAEFCLNFIAPLYYLFDHLPDRTDNPYAGAPFVTLLQDQSMAHDRILGLSGLLFPNWASAFSLFDIRDLDAMYDSKYFPFLRDFLPPCVNCPDLSNRFTGVSEPDFRLPSTRRLLQLSSVKYIASVRPFTTSNKIIEEIYRQIRGHITPGKEIALVPPRFILDGEARATLGEHPPYERLPYKVTVGTRRQEVFHFSYALDPAVYDKGGDGVGFTIEVEDGSGKITKLFSDFVDPHHNLHQRRWKSSDIDLSRYRGQQIQLLFSTDSGPNHDNSYDWAAWSGFHFNDEPGETKPPFQLIYRHEAMVYRYDDVLPRASIYYHADLEPNETAVLHDLADPGFDVFEGVAVNGSKLTKIQLAEITQLARGAPERVRPATILSYRPRQVHIGASLDRPGILMLNDSDYPGWSVDVDGHRAAWLTVDYFFRGVLLSPGKHSIVYRYEPDSFRYGVLVSLAGVVFLFLFLHIEKSVAQKTPAAVTVSRL